MFDSCQTSVLFQLLILTTSDHALSSLSADAWLTCNHQPSAQTYCGGCDDLALALCPSVLGSFSVL